MASDEERARAKELLAEWNRWAACQPLEDDSAAKEDAEFVRMMAEALSAVRESALREAVDKLSDLPGPRRSCCTCCDDGYGDAVDHALAAVRALLPAPPPPPPKVTP